jgi:Fe-S cluster assembly protein SufD
MTQLAEKAKPRTATAMNAALDRRPTGGPLWLEETRATAGARFAALGFPTVRDEDWRFTSVAPIATADWPVAAAAALPPEQIDTFLYADAPHRVVFVNGRFVPALSRTDGLPAGTRVGSLAQDADPAIQRHFNRLSESDTRAFAALNTAFSDDGAYVVVPEDAILDAPIQLLFVSETAQPAMTHPRALVVLGKGSQSQIVETYVGRPGQVYFTNAVTEIFVGENAVLDHYKVQEESEAAYHVASMHIRAERSATFSSHSFALGGKLTRNDVVATMAGEGAECTLNGLYLADGERLVDNHTTIDHAMPHCPSHEIYKGILGGKARAVFNGKIIVRQDAQKTDAKQTNRALLLTDGATINTKPQLEIFADDVKCTHGATVGALNENMLFYLQSRCIPHAAARRFLTYAFAAEVVAEVALEPVRAELDRLVQERVGVGAKA